jgi:GT2 family glycosyltransferase/glycosyltransferase involved in cell wall biosynthesis
LSSRSDQRAGRSSRRRARPICGQVERLEGNVIVGWARGETDDHCSIAVVDPHGVLVARGAASVDRPEGFGFRVALPLSPRPGVLRVLADGVELANSPVVMGPGAFDGQVWLSQGEVAGWVTERVPGFAPPSITILDQEGRLVFRGGSLLDTIAPDVNFRPARFAGELDVACFGKGERRLAVFADSVRFAEVSCDLPLVGHLETVSAEECAGWLLSPAAPHRCFAIDILRDGAAAARVRCTLPRPDLADTYPGCRTPGFKIALAQPGALPPDLVTLSLRLAGTDIELFESPYVLASRPAAVTAARSLAQRAELAALTMAEQVVLRAALADFLDRARLAERQLFTGSLAGAGTKAAAGARVNLVIAVYRNVETTRACIESALAARGGRGDWIVLVNDNSPEPGMESLLAAYEALHGVHVLRNPANVGFVKSVNRALSFCSEGDVLLLNSDALLFAGGLEELQRIAHGAPDIGTVTALSNNATIFSYPHPQHAGVVLDDIDWPTLAAIALRENAGKAIDVPTGHGFCLYVKRDVLRRIGALDEAFGRGYGEENDFCARAADLGFRNVAAAGVFVEHRDGVSFEAEKDALLAQNLRLLHTRYPEYTALVMEAERRDDLRAGRWALDAARLRRAGERGAAFALLILHNLGGGTTRAIEEIEKAAGYGDALKITLICRDDGFLSLSCQAPLIEALFSPEETTELVAVLEAAPVRLVVVHQVLGLSEAAMAGLGAWLARRHAVFHVHDYYSLCPRVTMIDAAGRFCDAPPADVCTRCIALGGGHAASRLAGVPAERHRPLFAGFLGAFSHVVAPSESAASFMRRAFPGTDVEVVPHPELSAGFPRRARGGTDDEIVLIGAIGPHKGAASLVDIATLARLTRPGLRFRLIGHSDRDDALRDLGNVEVTGHYEPARLPELAARARGRLALFLSGWPETYSYTLTEAVRLGFVPLVPDIGALAERVRAAGFGVVFPFPVDPSHVLSLIDAIAAGGVRLWQDGASPASFVPAAASIRRTRALYLAPVRK